MFPEQPPRPSPGCARTTVPAEPCLRDVLRGDLGTRPHHRQSTAGLSRHLLVSLSCAGESIFWTCASPEPVHLTPQRRSPDVAGGLVSSAKWWVPEPEGPTLSSGLLGRRGGPASQRRTSSAVAWWKSGRAATTLLARRRPPLKLGEVHRGVLPRGLPGSAIVWSPPRCRMVIPAQWRARHAPVRGGSACPGSISSNNHSHLTG